MKREVANILSLPLLPPNKITTAFQESVHIFLSISSNLQSFLNYIKKTYIINAFKSDIKKIN